MSVPAFADIAKSANDVSLELPSLLLLAGEAEQPRCRRDMLKDGPNGKG